jgi:hypothetical protein
MNTSSTSYTIKRNTVTDYFRTRRAMVALEGLRAFFKTA